MIPAGTIFAKASGRELKSEATDLWFRDKETPKTTLGTCQKFFHYFEIRLVFLRPTTPGTK